MKWLWMALCLTAWSPVWAAPRLGTSGCIEGGWALGGAPRDSQWLIDLIEIHQRFDPSDRVRVYFSNVFAFASPTAAPGKSNNSSNYFSRYQLATSGTGGTMTLANAGAYAEFHLLDGLTASVGHVRVPFGTESLMSRYDSPAYFYSAAISAAQNQSWLWDLGLLVSLKRTWIPGELTLGILDGKATAGEGSPALTARYEVNIESGRLTFLPSASLYLGEFSRGITDVGWTLGLEALLGVVSIQAEWVRVYTEGAPGSTPVPTPTTSIYVEPAIDLGFFEAATKVEFENTPGASDVHLSFAATKMFAQRLRGRVLYQAAGVLGKIRAGEHDFRVMLGADW